MKSKYLFQVFVLIAALFSAMGGTQSALAQTPDPVVVVREMTFWDAAYTGYVDSTRYESWPFVLDASYDFSVTATPTSGNLSPLVILLDSTGTEITSGVGKLTASQPAGNYFVQIQPASGSGFYILTIRQTSTGGQPPVSSTVIPSTIAVDETAVVTISLNNIPLDGYASAEFVCTYDPVLVSVGNITFTALFGSDPATAISGPSSGNFIVAISGSNGQRAMQDGAVFSYSVTGLQAGVASITCATRVSMGDNVLIVLDPVVTTITITEPVLDGWVEGQVLATKSVTVSLFDGSSTLITSAVAAGDGTFSLMAPAGTYTVVAEAPGFLDAQGPAVIKAGEITTKATISLIAGDIDGNGVIDQYDAMTIGMSYNTATPDAADLNADGNIDVLDLEILAANYHASGALDWP